MSQRVAVTGATGQLGRELVRVYRDAGDEVLALARPDFDITRPDDLDRLAAWHPEVVINSAAWTDVDGCALDPARAMRINGEAAGAVAEAAARAGALVVQVSTNEVFDGSLNRPYTEEDAPNPINPYGASKLTGERLVRAENPRHLIVRTAWLFGTGERNFPGRIRAAAQRMLAEGLPLRVVVDEWGNPTDVRWLASAIRELTPLAERSDVYHLAGEPPTSREGWARLLVGESGVVVLPITLADHVRASRTPPRAVLSTAKARGIGIPAFDWRT